MPRLSFRSVLKTGVKEEGEWGGKYFVQQVNTVEVLKSYHFLLSRQISEN